VVAAPALDPPLPAFALALPPLGAPAALGLDPGSELQAVAMAKQENVIGKAQREDSQ
jgi:hypothetical protein